MKRLLIIVTILSIYGCGHKKNCKHSKQNIQPKNNINQIQVTTQETSEQYITIVKVRGCEYIAYHRYDRGGLTHMGNCKNPTHKTLSY